VRLRPSFCVAITISSRKSAKERRIDELRERLSAGDTLVVTELSRLGRSTGQIILLIDELLQQDIRVTIIKQQLFLDRNQSDLQSLTMVTLLSLFAEMERMMISRRIKDALATKKAQGLSWGSLLEQYKRAYTIKIMTELLNYSNLGCQFGIFPHITSNTVHPLTFITTSLHED